MKHRLPKRDNDQGDNGDSSGVPAPKWDRPLRFTVGGIVLVAVTIVTRSVGDGILAVTAVAAAAHGIPHLHDFM